MRRLILPLVLLTLSACATVQGAGRDISTAGDFVSDSARNVQQRM
ncbi:entericidin A/B family lipoprotein [Tropicimonas isoalkanivorans]|uniref:Predicted small secreted protein n=1 Tax=Tropicimonas isoalkanivorans TaxID=441112 RepID=A0A1I1IGU8_9RHOB|nr:entericidin A/B family lipoprotein [Tropicimonas isoalkanivorans]SFC35517.1 Predicted small secreted protein [Tropicimonas isoalkanivorans]